MNLLPSIIRTAVPVAVGYLVSLPLVVRVEDLLGVDEADRSAWIARGLTALITVVYYAAARWIEQHNSKLGSILVGLGVAKAPVYPPTAGGAHAAAAPAADADGYDRI